MIRPAAILVLASLLMAGGTHAARAAENPFSPQQLEFFETKVRPLLVAHCQKCHGAKAQKGGLRLDIHSGVLKGGDTGPAVIPGKPADSPMIEAINYRGLEMPPTGKLKDREIAALTEWVKMGAPWPNESAASGTSRAGDFAITEQDRRYWAYQPIGRPQPPAVKSTGWVANPIDAFILHKLETKGLQPNGPADRRTLLRRLSFDLVGLPPTPEEVDAFIADKSPNAYERRVDELLSRKQYGERWGRHWLDVARFAQTNGYERDGEKPEAWRYRDYVIDAFNNDLPYNRFIVEQLAGDELDEPTNSSIIATGFYRLGIWDDEPDDKRVAACDDLDEIIRTTSSAFLGLTLGCARCHNHMFDPIPQEDYYQLAAFFRNVEPYGKAISTTHFKDNVDGIFTPLTSPETFATWKQKREKLTQEIVDAKTKMEAARKPAADRLIAARQSGAPSKEDVTRELNAAERAEIEKLKKQVAELEQKLRTAPFPQALSVRETGSPPPDTHVLIRGNPATPGKKVEPKLLTILGGESPRIVPASMSTGSGRLKPALAELGVKPTLGARRALAEWIASDTNPLTPRVLVNRLWQEHFGRGIVSTTDNFGRAGAPPTHPELLAWLARDFIDGGWRIKRMHKLIVMSNAYRASSINSNGQAREVDGDNHLFWRQNLHRLDAEAIRDAMLAVSGQLNLAAGGHGFYPALSADVLATQSKPGFGWGKSSPAEQNRRSVYAYLKRTLMIPFFETFDYTNTADSLGTRPITTVAPQALLLLNSDFTLAQAKAMAARVRKETGSEPGTQIDRAFRLGLGRAPTERERKIAETIMLDARSTEAAVASSKATQGPDPLESLCLIVLNLNEFVYID